MNPKKISSGILLSLCCCSVFAQSTSTKSQVQTTDIIVAESNDTMVDPVFSRLLHQESRGRQFGANGKPLTSPKGAVGVAQVMPSTAPEAARMAGIEWNEWRYRNDATYNTRLGRAYYETQLEKYNGNHVLALAAYNAGPKRVDNWVQRYGDPRKGEISNSAFTQLIPIYETQQYVTAILGGVPDNSGFKSSVKAQNSDMVKRYEFRDTHPGFAFNIAVNRPFNANTKLVGGL